MKNLLITFFQGNENLFTMGSEIMFRSLTKYKDFKKAIVVSKISNENKKELEKFYNIFDDIILSNFNKILSTNVDKLIPQVFDLPSSILLNKEDESKMSSFNADSTLFSDDNILSKTKETTDTIEDPPIAVSKPFSYFKPSTWKFRGGNKSKKRKPIRKQKRTKQRH